MACDPTGILRDEHRLILRVLDGLEAFLDRDTRDADRAREFVEFFSLFTDALHHGKEEDHLFGTLVEQGFPLHQGPIAQMLQEHELGRALVRQMATAVEGLAADPDPSRRAFDYAGRSYIDLLRQHIRKEDGALFEMADGAVVGPVCQRLCDAYDEVCGRRFGGRTMQELERLGEALAGS